MNAFLNTSHLSLQNNQVAKVLQQNLCESKAQDGVEREDVFQLARNKIEILVELVGINDIFLDRHAYCVTAISMDY